MDLVVGKIEEGTARLEPGLGFGKHKPWELRREMGRNTGYGGPPRATHGLKPEVIAIDSEFFGDYIHQFFWELGPIHTHLSESSPIPLRNSFKFGALTIDKQGIAKR